MTKGQLASPCLPPLALSFVICLLSSFVVVRISCVAVVTGWTGGG